MPHRDGVTLLFIQQDKKQTNKQNPKKLVVERCLLQTRRSVVTRECNIKTFWRPRSYCSPDREGEKKKAQTWKILTSDTLSPPKTKPYHLEENQLRFLKSAFSVSRK